MFDPRTLPDPGFWTDVSWVYLWLALLADCLITRWGVWYYGFVEANPLIRNKYWDLTKSAGLTFLDACLRLALVGGLLALSDHFGYDTWQLPVLCSAGPLFGVIHNLLLIRKLPKKK